MGHVYCHNNPPTLGCCDLLVTTRQLLRQSRQVCLNGTHAAAAALWYCTHLQHQHSAPVDHNRNDNTPHHSTIPGIVPHALPAPLLRVHRPPTPHTPMKLSPPLPVSTVLPAEPLLPAPATCTVVWLSMRAAKQNHDNARCGSVSETHSCGSLAATAMLRTLRPCRAPWPATAAAGRCGGEGGGHTHAPVLSARRRYTTEVPGCPTGWPCTGWPYGVCWYGWAAGSPGLPTMATSYCCVACACTHRPTCHHNAVAAPHCNTARAPASQPRGVL